MGIQYAHLVIDIWFYHMIPGLYDRKNLELDQHILSAIE